MAQYTHSTTDFEYRHQTLVHQLIVGAAFLTYLIDREDVVWRLVKNTANPHVLERSIFIVARYSSQWGPDFALMLAGRRMAPGAVIHTVFFIARGI